MTDTDVTKTGEIDNMDETNNVGNTSANSKESDVENVDAIKKYIEEQEQEMLLENPSPVTDMETSIETQNPVETTQHECKILQHQHALTDDSDTVKTLKKQSVVLSPNKTKTVIENQEQLSKEVNKSQPETSFVNYSRSDQVKEDNFVNEAETTSPLEDQSVRNMQTNIIRKTEKNNDDQTEMSINNKIEDLNNCEIKYEESRTSDSSNPPVVHKLVSSENKDELKSKCQMVSDFETQGATEGPKLLQQLLTSGNTLNNKTKKSEELKCEQLNVNEHSDETLAIATSVIDMILTDTETAINKKNVSNVISKQLLSPEKVNSSVSLAIGSKVEAKDFSELWYPAEIVEVDSEEMEVLVQYDNQPKKHNEWISISSPRLRPISSSEAKLTMPATPSTVNTPEIIPETKTTDKQKVTFTVGERCLARWRDNRRFIATIQSDLGNGSYEVMFDDGFQWKCTLSRLYKLKESSKHDYMGFNTSMCPSPAPSPAGEQAPPAAAAPAAPPAPAAPAAAPFATNGHPHIPAYHTHLFDPTRDYLGSKSERREMKRKLNIKEIFNIGQKRKKLPTVDKETKRAFVSTKQVEGAPPGAAHRPASPEKPPVTINPPVKTNSALEIKHHAKKKPAVKKKPFMRKKIKLKTKRDVPFLNDVKNELPDAVAAIIGTVCKAEPDIDDVKTETPDTEEKDSNANDIKPELAPDELANSPDKIHTLDNEHGDLVIKEENKAENFEAQEGVKHEEVIDKIKEVITKLEDGINEVEHNEVKPEIKEEEDVKPALESIVVVGKEKRKKSSKVKKGKKLRLMQEKKVKKQVEKVKCQLEEMKKQVEAMRKQILLKTEELAGARGGEVEGAGAGCLLPGEWACRWVDGQPAGAVSEVECDARADAAAAADKPPLPRRSVQVEDNRLPPGWTKHMVRRSLGNSAGKWDVVLVSPENRRIHTKNDMRIYLENNPDEGRAPYEPALLDFGIHLKLARRLGWVGSSAAGAPPPPPPSRLLHPSSPLLKRRKLNNKHRAANMKTRRELKIKLPRLPASCEAAPAAGAGEAPVVHDDAVLDGASIKDGFVHVGSLKVQVIETLLRCPAENCFKNFRNTTLLKMHIKHYHRELRKMMGATPKVLDLAYARTHPSEAEIKRLKCEAQQRIIKVKLPRLHKRPDEPKPEPKEVKAEPSAEPPPATPPAPDELPKRQDSPKLRNALVNKPPKRPKVLLPVRSAETEVKIEADTNDCPVKLEEADDEEMLVKPKLEVPDCGVLDFESAISTYTVSRVGQVGQVTQVRVGRRRRFASIAPEGSEEEWPASEGDTRSSLSGDTPDSRPADTDADADADADDAMPLSLAHPTHHTNNDYLFTENGERIKLVRMKREEIINCHCGFREEDGLMVQCELCLCWQHALCHNIQREAEVPEKYTCSICLNPRRGRRRQRFTHDQDRLYEGLLPAGGGGRASEPLRRAHELAGNLLRAADALHAVRVNTHVAAKKNHPKLYLWAKDWETVELTFAQEKLNSEYSDLNVIINNLGKENLPLRAGDVKETALDIKTPPGEQEEKFARKENQMGSQALLSGLLSSPDGVSLDLSISESELEKLAKSVQAVQGAPQPEPAIEDGACRARLLRHVQRCHALLDQRLDSIEAQVAELESCDPMLEDDETAAFYPRTKQTMHMLLRDLDTMEELGIVT